MRHLPLALAFLLASSAASAQDMRPGIASIAVISTEADGRYGMDGDVVKPARLKRTLVLLDEQLPIGYVHLRRGAVEISAERLAKIRGIAEDIGARLMVERNGEMQPDAAPAGG